MSISPPTSKSVAVAGSGTAATAAGDAETAELATGAEAAVGSKMNVPAAPTANAPPLGRAEAVVTVSAPSATVVPPS